jgi:RNA polymerase sigma-70 factor (ECF subfamily)
MARRFDEVYAHEGREVYGYLCRLTGDPARAEELCQETFLRYFRQEAELVALNGSLRFWLIRVATRLGLDDLRRRTRWRRLVPHLRPRPPAAGADAACASADLEARIRAEVERLDPPVRAAFLLRAHHALGFREIGDALGISERAAKDRFRRARERLRATLAHLREETPHDLR